MKKTVIILVIISSNFFCFSQVKIGINLNSGLNNEFIYSNNHLIPDLFEYKLSHQAGLWFGIDLSKKLSLNVETNYFIKNTQIDTHYQRYNYLEIPIYVVYNFGKFHVLGGIVNNFPINNEFIRTFYVSSKFGIGYSLNNCLKFRICYNQEFISHNDPVMYEGLDQKNYFNSFMFGVVVKLFEL